MLSDDCGSNEEKSLGESGGEEEISSSEDDMMLGLTDEALRDSIEEEELGVPRSSSLKLPVPQSQSLLPQTVHDQPNISNPDFLRTSVENKLPDPEPLLSFLYGSSYQSRPGESDSASKTNPTSSEKDSTGENGQNPGFRCKMTHCSVVKSSEKDLFEHVRIHHSDRKHRCDICPKAFMYRSELTKHKIVHSGDKPFQCDECGMKFALKVTLKRHQHSIHNKEKLVSCRLKSCGLRLPKSELYEHIRTAHPREKFQCDACPMSFNRSDLLNKHKRKHDGNKPFQCEVCEKKFSTNSSYKKHLNLHTGERPFKCDICGKGFSQAVHMRKHMRLHTGEKPFPCSFCVKYFTSSSDRNVHERSCSANQ